MWATRLRCPSEAAYPQPAGDPAVGSAAGGPGEVEQFVDKSAAARRIAPSVRLAVGLGSGGALRGRGRRVRAAERGPVDADGDAMVLQPIDQGVDQRLLVEQIVPLGQVEVGGDDGGGAVVALIHQTEEGVGLLGLEGQVAEFVNEERTITAHLLEKFSGRPIGQGGVKLVQEGLGVIKTAAMAVQTGLPQQTHGQAGFAGSRLAYEQDVLVAPQEVQAGQGLDLGLRHPRLAVIGEGVQGPAPRKMRLPEAIGETALLTVGGLLAEKPMENLRRGDSLLFGAL